MVRLLLCFITVIALGRCCFNPTMVRLLHEIIKTLQAHQAAFQSHNGAIAALEALFFVSVVDEFQSHNGAIAAFVSLLTKVGVLSVSIPQWCDCCAFNAGRRNGFAMVSIPQWCDCCTSLNIALIALNRVSIPQWCDCCEDEETFFVQRPSVSIPQWCDCCYPLP